MATPIDRVSQTIDRLALKKKWLIKDRGLFVIEKDSRESTIYLDTTKLVMFTALKNMGNKPQRIADWLMEIIEAEILNERLVFSLEYTLIFCFVTMNERQNRILQCKMRLR